jgi:hypothetical protein
VQADGHEELGHRQAEQFAGFSAHRFTGLLGSHGTAMITGWIPGTNGALRGDHRRTGCQSIVHQCDGPAFDGDRAPPTS